MWGYEAANDRWHKLAGQAPTGAYVSADIAPEKRLLLLVSNTQAPNQHRSHDVLYTARTTYAYRIDAKTIDVPVKLTAHQAMLKRPAGQSGLLPDGEALKLERLNAQAEKLRQLPVNQWVALNEPARAAPARAWGSRPPSTATAAKF